MTKARLFWGLWCVLLGAGLFFSCQRVSERGRFAAPYSSFSAGKDGSLGLFRLTNELGFAPERLSHEIARLTPHATLVAMGGCDEPSSRELKRPEREALAAWIERGGLLIVLGAGDYVPEAIGLKLTGNATCKRESEDETAFAARANKGTGPLPFALEAVPAGAPLAYAPALTFEGSRRVTTDEHEQATVLFESEQGPVAMTMPYGRGRVVLFGASSPFTNAHLAGGGAVVFARLLRAFARPSVVLFDEYHLGMGERRSVVGYLRERGLTPVLLQGLLIVACFLVATGARLGPARVGDRPLSRGTKRFLFALSSLLARTRDRQGALEVLARHGLMRIKAQYRATFVPIDELEHWLEAHGRHAAATFAARVREHAQKPLGPKESLRDRAEQLERDVDAAIVIGVE